IIKSLPRGFKQKGLIKNNFSKIKDFLNSGAIMAIKNFHNKHSDVNISKIPLTINIPIGTFRGGRKNASLSFTYNPKNKKINTTLWSYSFQKNFSNKNGSGGTPIGTHIGKLENIGGINKNVSNSGHAMYGFIMRKRGIDGELNKNSLNRGILSHGIVQRRRNLINSGNGSTTLGCTAYGDMSTANIYKENKASKYIIEETTYPIL
ncbi:MAG: hypothetical protein Q9M94_07270, partial [Candidatus Gracilibacteria bacterium]|nr:hypothetical protein [Candidatus Gracilibacteria bacterium]